MHSEAATISENSLLWV